MVKVFREYINDVETPYTVEAPIFRSIEDIRRFSEDLSRYKLDRYIGGVNIVNYPFGRLTPDPVTIGYIFREYSNIDVIIHVSSSIESEYTLARLLYTLYICNMQNILLLGGDLKTGYGMKLDKSMEYISMVRSGYIKINGTRKIEDFDIYVGGALIPDRPNEVDRVLWKVSMGMDFFQTQFIFNHPDILKLLIDLDERLRREYPHRKIPVLIGLLPLVNDELIRIFESTGLDDLKRFQDREYENIMKKVLNEIFKVRDKLHNLKIGIHFMPIMWREDTYEYITRWIEWIGT